MNHGIGILRSDMREKIILITGSNGEIGQELIKTLSKMTDLKIVALDLNTPVDVRAKRRLHQHLF